MSPTNSLDDRWEKVESFSDLEKLYTLQEIVAALRDHDRQRFYHKRYNAKRSRLVELAVQAGLDKDLD